MSASKRLKDTRGQLSHPYCHTYKTRVEAKEKTDNLGLIEIIVYLDIVAPESIY